MENHIGEILRDDNYVLDFDDLVISPEPHYGGYCVAVGNNCVTTGAYAMGIGDDVSCDEPYGFEYGTSLMGIPMHDDFKNICANHPDGLKWFIRILGASCAGDLNMINFWKEYYSEK